MKRCDICTKESGVQKLDHGICIPNGAFLGKFHKTKIAGHHLKYIYWSSLKFMLEKDLEADLDVTIGSDLAAGLKNVWVNPVNPASYSVMES